MSIHTDSPRRPYWHVDAKWVTGLLLFVTLSITFLAFNLWQVTAADPGINALTLLLASAFSPEGLDSEADIALMQEQLQASSTGEIQPVPGLRITIHAEDIAGLSPREVRLFFFRQWAEPLYYQGAAGLAELADDPAMRQSIEEGIGPLALLSAQSHQQLLPVWIGLALLDLLLILLLIVFSYRFGRLSSPGCVLFLTALPAAALLALVRQSLLNQLATAPPTSESLSARLLSLAVTALPGLLDLILRNYLIVAAVGLGLILLALLGALFWPQRRQPAGN